MKEIIRLLLMLVIGLALITFGLDYIVIADYMIILVIIGGVLFLVSLVALQRLLIKAFGEKVEKGGRLG